MPLWNPYENLGIPLAGNPAASVFYPGKLIFALPISYPWAYKIYIMDHLLLAAGSRLPAGQTFPGQRRGRRAVCRLLRLLRQRAVYLLQRGLPGRRRMAAAGHAGRGSDASRGTAGPLGGGGLGRCWR